MMVIQQAIYGEVPGQTSGHDLLAASGEKDELFRRVSGLTDLADRPQGGIPNPIVRGLFAEGHFLLIKAFPDVNSKLRSGRLFVHVLFIANSDVHRVRNINDLFRYHLPVIQKDAEMRPLEYDPQVTPGAQGAVNGRAAAATNALLNNEPFAWLGEEGYWEWMTSIWPQLPARVVETLRVGAAFSPAYAKSENLNLLFIPNDAKTLWERHSFQVIDTTTTATLNTAAAHWLVGDVKAASPFQTLLDDFAPKIDSIDLVNRLQTHGNVYHQLDQKPKLSHLLVLAHFISRVNPDERTGIKGKARLLSVILKVLPDASIEQIRALKDQSWNGFPGAVEAVSAALRAWLAHHLLQGPNAKESGSVLAKALEASASNWWSKAVLTHVADRLGTRQPNDAAILWQWMIGEPALIAAHASWLPDDAESELAQKIPKLQPAVAEAVLHMAEQKCWLLFHAKVAARCYSPAKAIEAQLRIDTDVHHASALEALSEEIDGKAFIPVATVHTDARLHRIAGRLIAKNSKLLQGLDIASQGWQCCWEAAIELGAEVWTGVLGPQQTLFSILDHLLAGKPFSAKLLEAMSASNQGSLKNYSQRASIWQKLPAAARSGFIAGTLVEMIDELALGQLKIGDLETELKGGLKSQELQQRIISSSEIPISKRIRLIELLPGLGAEHLQQLMRSQRLSSSEAEQLGQLALQKGWGRVAEDLYHLRSHRKDLVPALLKCSSLLGFLKRVNLSVSGLKRDAISKEEWWGEFLKISIELYPLGPEQHGLWESTGGDLSQILTNGTGRDKWSHAIRILRNDGKPAIETLITEMLKTYSQNETLKGLQHTL